MVKLQLLLLNSHNHVDWKWEITRYIYIYVYIYLAEAQDVRWRMDRRKLEDNDREWCVDDWFDPCCFFWSRWPSLRTYLIGLKFSRLLSCGVKLCVVCDACMVFVLSSVTIEYLCTSYDYKHLKSKNEIKSGLRRTRTGQFTVIHHQKRDEKRKRTMQRGWIGERERARKKMYNVLKKKSSRGHFVH